MSSVYQVNKGINRPMEFKGLTAQYIWWLGGGVTILLFLFAVMYVLGAGMIPCVMFVLSSGTVLFWIVFRMSRRYGEHGLMKARAAKAIPKQLKGISANELRSVIRKK